MKPGGEEDMVDVGARGRRELTISRDHVHKHSRRRLPQTNIYHCFEWPGKNTSPCTALQNQSLQQARRDNNTIEGVAYVEITIP